MVKERIANIGALEEIFKRPGVARAVLQPPSSLIHSFAKGRFQKKKTLNL